MKKSVLLFFSQKLNVGVQLGDKFFVGDAAERLIGRHQGNVAEVVEGAEDAHLRELGYAGDENELQVVVEGLEGAEEGGEALSHTFLQLAVANAVEHEGVVLIDEDNGRAARLAVSLLHDGDEPQIVSLVLGRSDAILTLVFGKDEVNQLIEGGYGV